MEATCSYNGIKPTWFANRHEKALRETTPSSMSGWTPGPAHQAASLLEQGRLCATPSGARLIGRKSVRSERRMNTALSKVIIESNLPQNASAQQLPDSRVV